MLFDNYKLIDLTHTVDESMPSWTGRCGFRHEVKMDYDQGVRVLGYKMHAGGGTHMDAPSHFIPDGANIADIPIENFFVPVCIIDVSAKRSPDLLITPDDILLFEKTHGKIPKKSLVIGYTGWQEFWADGGKYRNADVSGKIHFPGFSGDSATLLLEREVVGIGIDTLSPDGSNTKDFPVHKIILGAGKYILENLTNLDKMPPSRAYAIVLPLKVKVGTEAPIRAIGVITNS